MINKNNTSILVVDDERDICLMVSEILQDQGYNVKTAVSKDSAMRIIEESGITLVITDIWMEDNENAGIELLEWCKNYNSLIPVLIMSGHGTIETAMSAAKNGAYDFIEKPFNTDRLLLLIEKSLNDRDMRIKLLESQHDWFTSNDLIGVSSAIKNIKNLLLKLSQNNSRILLSGFSGSGKETCARFIHTNSTRANHPFVKASFSSLSIEMINELLFGISNENLNKVNNSGLLEQANFGTIYFNEICDLPLEIQDKLVHIIQDQAFYKTGSNKKIKLDLRIISATSKNPIKAVENKLLRDDLFYRLSVVPISIPALKDRPEDVPHLIKHFMTIASNLLNKFPLDFSDDTIAILETYDWPGNIRQLKNTIEWLLIMYGNKENYTVKTIDLPPEISSNNIDNTLDNNKSFNLPLKDARKIFEKDYLERQLMRFKGNIAKTSSFVGMDRSALHRKLKELEINFKN
jgi:two-component system nitrogen regulation response regulator NtrX